MGLSTLGKLAGGSALVLGILLFAVSGVLGTTGSPDTPYPVSITNGVFHPGKITVLDGTTIVWKNHDDSTHTLSSSLFSSSTDVAHGATFSFTFKTNGKYFVKMENGATDEIDVVPVINSKTPTAEPQSTPDSAGNGTGSGSTTPTASDPAPTNTTPSAFPQTGGDPTVQSQPSLTTFTLPVASLVFMLLGGSILASLAITKRRVK